MSAILLLIAALAVVNIEATETCTRDLDIGLLVDSSTSICGGPGPCPRWNAMLQLCKDIINSVTIGPRNTRVALGTLADNTVVHWDLRKYTDTASLLQAVDNVPYRGGEFTDLLSIARIITEMFNPLVKGDRWGVQNIGIIITDGAPYYPDFVYQLVSTAVRVVRGVGVFVVCLTPDCTEHCARGLSSHPKKANETYFLVDNYRLFDQYKDTLVKQVCTYQPILTLPILDIGLN